MAAIRKSQFSGMVLVTVPELERLGVCAWRYEHPGPRFTPRSTYVLLPDGSWCSIPHREDEREER